MARRNGNPDSIKYYAQELKENAYNLTRMNLIMRGLKPANIITRNGDTLEDDWPWFDSANKEENYTPLFIDAVVSNPPYSQHWDPEGKDSDLRYVYGIAPKSKADYAFLLHDLYHLRPDGIMTIVLPHGVLFRGGEEGVIRKNLLEHRHIQAIIGLPANIFFATNIPTIIMVLRKDKPTSDVLMVDASKYFIKDGNKNKLQASDIKRIVDVVTTNSSVEGFSRLVTLEEIRANDYNLNIPRYVDSSDPAESWDMYSLMFGGIPQHEIDVLSAYWQAWPSLRESLFQDINQHVASFKVENAAVALNENSDVQRFVASFQASINPLAQTLEARLFSDPTSFDVLTEQDVIAQEIKTITDAYPLVSEYDAYQKLDDAWGNISIDMEIIQTEGLNAVRKVDPHMIIKKVQNKDTEVQDGWEGHVLPFALVQKELLGASYSSVVEKETRLASIDSELTEIIEGISEEDKPGACLKSDESTFVASKLKKCVKEIQKGEASEFEESLVRAYQLLEEAKKLNKELKEERLVIESQTKETIEQLSDSQVKQLLYAKWITPLCTSLEELPMAVVAECASRVQTLATKYDTTYASVCANIEESERGLASMLDNLVGNEFDMAGLTELKTLLGGE